jgi:hypothetical protein
MVQAADQQIAAHPGVGPAESTAVVLNIFLFFLQLFGGDND